MLVLSRTRQSLVPWRSRLALPRAFVVVVMGIVSGCASAPPSSTLIPILPTEGARWVSAETVEAYRCRKGALVCSGDSGRLSERRCRC